MSWDDIGDAIQAALARASGLDPSRVVWADQDRGAPALDYLSVNLGTVTTLGVDYIRTSQDLTRPRGMEIELAVRGQREVPLQIQAFTSESVAGRQGSALALLTRTLAGLVLPSIRTILQAQDVSAFDPGPVQWIPDVPSTSFRGRAIATVRCYMPAPTVSEYVGYIDRVSGNIIVQGGAGGDTTTPFDTGPVDGGGS